MTTVTAERAASTERPVPGSNRIIAVFRLHFVNVWSVFTVPWLIMALIFIVNLSIWLIIFTAVDEVDKEDVSNGLQWSGSSFYIFVYMFVMAIQAINVTFPFALGYGVTRRHYYLGTALAFVAMSALYAVILTVLATIETATDGWGFGGRMFTAVYFGSDVWYEYLLVYFAIFVGFFFFGALIGTIYVRWKTNGTLAFFAILALLLVAGIGAITYTDSWLRLWEFLVGTSAVGHYAFSLVPTTLMAIAAYFVIRRATPKN